MKFDKSVCFGVLSRAEQSKGLICSKGLKAGREGGKRGFDLELDFWQKNTSLVELS